MDLTALIKFAVLIALRRTVSDWRLQVAAAFGMLLAVALMASGVIYSQALAETALRNTLVNVPEEDLNITFRTFHNLDRPAVEASERYVEERIRRPLSPYAGDDVLLIQTSTLFLSGLPQLDIEDSSRPRSSLQAISDLPSHVQIIEGRMPRSGSGEIEVLIDSPGASALSLSVGDRFQAFRPGSDRGETVTVMVSGIFGPSEPDAHYWDIGTWDRFTNLERQWIALPLYTTHQNLLQVLPDSINALLSDFVWLFFMDVPGLRASEVEALQSVLHGITLDLRSNVPNSNWRTQLDEVLDRYSSLLLLARVPLFLVVFLVVSVLLYYMFLIAGLIGRVRTSEVAVFRSRGASTLQVGLVILVEGLIMALPAVVAGPFVAQALVLFTGRLFPVASGVQGLAVSGLSFSTLALGAVGAAFTVAVFTATVLRSASKGIVSLQSSSARPPEVPFIHRYYIDVVLLVVIGLLWWQLRYRGSFLIQPAPGSPAQIDITLLLGPILGVLAAGLLVLRVVPLVLRTAALIAEPFGRVWIVHALNRVARDPIPSGSLLVLLALAASLGMLGSSILSTLERSQEEQARYQAGADLRVEYELDDQLPGEQNVAGTVSDISGVATAAEVMRLDTRVTTEAFGSPAVLLAVDTDSFSDAAWVRPDILDDSLRDKLQRSDESNGRSDGIPIPLDTTAIGIWVQAGRVSPGALLIARMQDGTGAYFDMRIGEVAGQGWHYIEESIPSIRSANRTYTERVLQPPFTLRALWMGGRRVGAGGGIVFLGQLQAVTPAGPVELASFQSVDGWRPLEDLSAPGLYTLDISEAVTRAGSPSAAFTWVESGLTLRGIRPGTTQLLVPALVSRELAHSVGEGEVLLAFVGSTSVPLVVRGTTEFFPTLDPRESPFLVADLDALLDYLYMHGNRLIGGDTEVWVQLDGTVSSTSIAASIEDAGWPVSDVYHASTMVEARTSDPLLTAGWSGLLALSFLAVVMAGASSLILYTYIDARERLGEFAVLRSLGFSRLQVNGIVWFNLAITFTFGLAAGTLGGQLLGIAVLPLLEVAEDGSRITPPMLLQNNWPAVAFSYLVLGAATLITVAILAWALGKLELQRLLRVVDT